MYKLSRLMLIGTVFATFVGLEVLAAKLGGTIFYWVGIALFIACTRRLRDARPEAYADITQDAVASQLRALEVDVRGVRETGRSKDGPRSGCYRAELERLSGGGDA